MPAGRVGQYLHERWKCLGWVRAALRSQLYTFVRKVFGTDDGKAILSEGMSGLLAWYPRSVSEGLALGSPYPELGRSDRHNMRSERHDAVIITGRFRSGSTLLWNLFRQAGEFTAYYEPFNERRWFDPQLRGGHTDATHRNVSEYWREYDGLQVLGQYYREDWIRRHLLMEEHSWDPEMTQYVDTLISRASGRPALQFNRIDFRLPWFRRHYPNATYIHIYRHPRDQWCSTLMEDVKRFTKNDTVADFPPFDKFYLRMWAQDLKYHFPFLDEKRCRHPYQIFYYIWKLSYLFGVKHCDYSIQFEALVGDPDEEIAKLFDTVGARPVDPKALRTIVTRPPVYRWHEYADEAWFQNHEARCEAVLAEFLGLDERSASPTSEPRGVLVSRPGVG
jgi:hypothetical protein